MKTSAVSLACILAFISSGIAAPEAFEVSPDLKSQLPGGKEADGIVGDFILRNDKVEAVISGNLPLRRANMSTFYGDGGITPGCLYDLTLRGTNNDQITVFTPSQQQGPVSWVRVVKDGSDGEAIVECVVTGASRDGVMRKHEYRLRDGWQGVLMTTTLTNESKAAKKITPGDRWTNFRRTGAFQGIAWADAPNPADKAGYAYGVTEAPEGFAPTRQVELKPGETLRFSRFLGVGRSPVEAVGEVSAQRGPVGTVAGVVRGPEGPVSTGEIIVRSTGQQAGTVGVIHPDAQGRFSVVLPPGTYAADFTDIGREPVTKEFEVKADAQLALEAEMAAVSAVQFEITDEAGRGIPCKVQFLALDGTEAVNLGPEYRAHGCRDQYHSEKGQFRVQLPPGKYRIVATRGIEYGHIAQEVTLAAGQTLDFKGQLKRLVDTKGWVSTDYHTHSTVSGDNICGTDDRLINLAAEHIEFAPTTEHNRLYDWRPHIEKLGLVDFIQTVPGLELTGSGTHLNAFPFKPVPYTQDNGAPVWNKDPRISAITLRDWQGADPDRWIQLNHPDMAANFVDANGDGNPDGGFRGLASLVDGYETQNYADSSILLAQPYRIVRDRNGREAVREVREFVWLQMLNRGHRIAAMAVCDSHTVWGNGVGGWRMYMPSKSDDPKEIDWRENVRAAKAGRSYLTTGPFLQVATDDGTGPGGTTRATRGGVTLKINVQCTDWIDIDRVQILVNGRQRKDMNFTRASHANMFRKEGVVRFDAEVFVPLSEDAHLIVVARGEKSDLRIGYGSSDQAKIRPTAYHNPIFIDVDGGGFTPNGDLLDWPLPTKRIPLDRAKAALRARGLADAPPPLRAP